MSMVRPFYNRVVLQQVLEIQVRDSPLTGRADLGRIKYSLRNIPPDGHISTWLPVEVSPFSADSDF